MKYELFYYVVLCSGVAKELSSVCFRLFHRDRRKVVAFSELPI